MRAPFRLLPVVFFSVLGFCACGGNTSDGGEHGGVPSLGGSETGGKAASGGVGTGGRASSGGVPATGGAIGSGGVIGSGGWAPTSGGCCAKLVLCPPGEMQVSNNASCPAGSECHVIEECCQRVICSRPIATCNAIPTCDEGDRQLMGACPPSLDCYTRTLCGTTIYCVSATGTGGSSGAGGGGGAGGACDPKVEYNRKYVTTNPGSCLLIDYACPATTRAFTNDCGCGCEQASSCPEFVNCMPGSASMNPLCGSQDCPYTVRAQ